MITIAGLVLAYLGIGVLFLLCYLLAFKPQSGEAQLGLIALGWPIIILIDIGLAIASQFGKVGKAMQRKIKSSK